MVFADVAIALFFVFLGQVSALLKAVGSAAGGRSLPGSQGSLRAGAESDDDEAEGIVPDGSSSS